MSANLIKNCKIGLYFYLAMLASFHSAFALAGSLKQIKNIILVIGDGMGPQQVGLLEEYAKRAPNSIYKNKKTALSQIMKNSDFALSQHYPADHLVVDSACSATQIATGKPAPSEVIGLDALGNPTETVLERARKIGYKTALISDTRITHATPAAFAAHAHHRSVEDEIAVQMIEQEVDIMLSGGLRYFLPRRKLTAHEKELIPDAARTNFGFASHRNDTRNLLLEAKNKGYHIALTSESMHKTPKNKKVLGLFADSGMHDGIRDHNTRGDHNRTQPSLKDMTTFALNHLEKEKKPFFMMLEGGQIDWAAHENDAGTMLHEMIKLDEALLSVLNFAENRNDTLVIITADHETGGFGFSYSMDAIPKPEPLAGIGFKNNPYQPSFNFGSVSNLDALYQQNKSFAEIFADFDDLPKERRTKENLAKIISQATGMNITSEEAERALKEEPNAYKVEGHQYLSVETVPVINEFKEYFPFPSSTRSNILARIIAKRQQVVWSTGTHTHTPVPVIIYGIEQKELGLSGMLHHTDIGKAIFKVLNHKKSV